MHNKKIIALCGRAQSGKSLAARFLNVRGGYHIMSYADPIKQMLLTMGGNLGLEHRHLYGSDADKNERLEVLGNNSARRAMQTLGTEWRDTLHLELWVHHLHMRINKSSQEYIGVDDMRHEHEYNMMKEVGATIIGIERPSQGTSGGNHKSEVWDFKSTGMPVIQNDGTKEELYLKLQQYL